MAKLTPESAWEFADAIKAIVKPQTIRRKATVQNVDKDGTIWVNLPGSSTVTPIQSTGANVSPGDTVLTELRGTSLHITENQTNPAIGESTARSIARQETQHAEAMAKQAQTIADEAQAVAEATNQHFFADDNGAHITDVTQDEWTAAVADEFSDYDPDTKPYHNQLLNSLGILLRTALNNLVSITRSAIAFYDGTGNESSNIVASFGSDGAQIGLSNESHMELDYHSLQLKDKEGNAYFHVSDLRDANGDITDEYIGDGSKTVFYLTAVSRVTSYDVKVNGVLKTSGVSKYTDRVEFITAPSANAVVTVYYPPTTSTGEAAKAYTLGTRRRNVALGLYSISEGIENVAFGQASHAEGKQTYATGIACHSEGYDTIAGTGYSHAEGYTTKATALYSHSEGRSTTASDETAHAEGKSTTASGYASHSQGNSTTASGAGAHAEGASTVASGTNAHAQNLQTRAASSAQTAIGKYNVEDDQDTYALIVGNGTADNARSNVLAVRWTGDDCAANDPGVIAAYSKTVDGTETPSSNTYARLLSGVDVNDEMFGSVSMYRSTDNGNYFQIEAQNANSGGTMVYNTLKLGVKDDGTRVVGFSDAAVWRTALGLGTLAQKSSVTFAVVNDSLTTSAQSIAANGGTASFTCNHTTPSGYVGTPTGVAGINSNHNTMCVVNTFTTTSAKFRNVSTSAASDLTCTHQLRYGKVTVS